MDKKTMKLLKQLISDAPEKIEAAKKEVSKSVKEGEGRKVIRNEI